MAERTCDRCTRKHCKGRHCTGHSSTTGDPCRNYPIKGHLVCKFHGGGTPQVRRQAEKNLAEQAMREKLHQLNITPVDDPLTQLKLLAGEVLAWKEILREKVEYLKDLRYGTEMGEAIRGEVLLFERALDRCITVLGVIAKLNIDDRLVAIEEAKVAKIVDAIDATLDHLGLPVDQRLAAKKEMARHLRAVG
jgi:hypothetical protein